MTTRADSRSLGIAAVVLGTMVLAAVVAATFAVGTEEGVLMIRNTVRLALAWYLVALSAMLFFVPDDWRANSLRGQMVRWCWTWALICFFVHLVLAFQFFHHWSNAHAVERSRQMSGWGEGIYFAYLFTVLWIADVVYWWLRPGGYASRSHWIDRSLHTFMLFIVLNGTIVFDHGIIRVAGALGGLVLIGAWIVARRPRRQAWAASTQAYTGPAGEELVVAGGLGHCGAGDAQRDQLRGPRPARKTARAPPRPAPASVWPGVGRQFVIAQARQGGVAEVHEQCLPAPSPRSSPVAAVCC